MPVWTSPPVDMQPERTLSDWCIVESDLGERHFVEHSLENHDGQVSSAIQRFDPVTRTGVTLSGRRYRLVGPPGQDPDALYVWEAWRTLNQVVSWCDITEQMLQDGEYRQE